MAMEKSKVETHRNASMSQKNCCLAAVWLLCTLIFYSVGIGVVRIRSILSPTQRLREWEVEAGEDYGPVTKRPRWEFRKVKWSAVGAC